MAGLFRDVNISEYISELSSRTVVPGGGSVSALTASLGAGLNLMVMNFSYGKKTSFENREILDSLKNAQSGIRDELILLIDEDCVVFKRLMQAVSSGNTCQIEYLEAANVPFKICERAFSSIRITSELLRAANRNLICDIGCAANILRAAFDSAELNVKINLKELNDKDLVSDLTGQLTRMRKEVHTFYDVILIETENIIS